MDANDRYEFYSSSLDSPEPKISVVISTYNRFRKEGDCPSLLKRAIESILNQTFRDFELILIDDASKDASADYCREIAKGDPRVRFYHFQKNSNLPAKRYNFGISVSRAKYLSFMFDDDAWMPNALADLYDAIESLPISYGLVYGLATLYIGNDRTHFEILGKRWGWNRIDSSNFISNNSVIVRRSAIDRVGGYDEDPVFARICDWDLWWRIGREFRVQRILKKVAIVYSSLHDSIEATKRLDWKACRKRQRSDRILPLQKKSALSTGFPLRPFLFDLYVTLCQRDRILKIARWFFRVLKVLAKKILPADIYQFLKKKRLALRGCLKCEVLSIFRFF